MKSRFSLLLALGLILQSFASLGTLAPAASDAFDAALAQGSSSLSVLSVSTIPLMILKEVIRADIVLCDEFNKAAKANGAKKSDKGKKPAGTGLSLACLESGLRGADGGSGCAVVSLPVAGMAQAFPAGGSRGSAPPGGILLFLLTYLVLLARGNLPWAHAKAVAGKGH